MKIKISQNTVSINSAIRELNDYQKDLERKGKEICRRLADYGKSLAVTAYSGTQYDGNKDVSVTVEERTNGYAIVASGETVLFLEFGAGVTYGYGHPQADQFGMGPGTYPDGKGHWDDPNGWWIPKSAGGGHTYGNEPSMAMYNAAKDLRAEIERVAREVFSE